MLAIEYPPEILYAICAAVHDAALASPRPSLDPLRNADDRPPSALPSSHPPSVWKTYMSRRTLASLCLVSKAWNEAARPWLWRRVEVTLPHSWMALVDQVAGEQDAEEELEVTPGLIDQTIRATLPVCPEDREMELIRSLAAMALPDSSIPPELLSPPASREPSPARLTVRAKSPGRWRLLRTVTDAVQRIVDRSQTGLYVPLPRDTHPGIHVRHLDFTHFRTIGMRRSIGEGVLSRFVTSDRLLRLLKEMPSLTAFGATEYMDGALTLPVLAELLFRGPAPVTEEETTRGRPTRRDVEPALSDLDADDVERRAQCKAIEALDLCGCVSAVFVNALDELVRTSIATEADDGTVQRIVQIPGMQRLGLRGLASIPSQTLSSLVLVCPNLTHLDLSGTRCGPELLYALGQSQTVRLKALALGRCVRLSAASIVDLLVHAPVTLELTQLSLYGDATFPSPLEEDDLARIVCEAPSFLCGKMEYLDLSSTPVTGGILSRFALQPALRSLGLSHILSLSLRDVAEFLENRAPNTEILCLVNSTPELSGAGASKREVNMSLHCKLVQPLCMPPFSISWGSQPSTPQPAATKLRVIELGVGTLAAVPGGGVGSWRVVRSKGGRAWYVDGASGWVDGVMRRDLGEDHPLRREIERLADANGNVGSGVGWHARKMEVLQGVGMLGREDGLYGAVSFAYQG
ncbi:hypothetical protein EXIGLDRAFT_656474 [Exidia glandulosa HHB12029]|uniref:Uncharacterized protein n=1 Tax=Exidia glandulosa HHB12029 TaxID=1314781 RepID=A0A165CUD1_EXIGL|nr:hypothetical protein EXIGLDRAFT_656474 [Exidia glandulosa HHB12029]